MPKIRIPVISTRDFGSYGIAGLKTRQVHVGNCPCFLFNTGFWPPALVRFEKNLCERAPATTSDSVVSQASAADDQGTVASETREPGAAEQRVLDLSDDDVVDESSRGSRASSMDLESRSLASCAASRVVVYSQFSRMSPGIRHFV